MTDKQLHDNRVRLGQRIAEIRKERSLTQQQVAEETGLLKQNISRIEGGRYNFGIDILAKIAAALECDVEFSPK